MHYQQSLERLTLAMQEMSLTRDLTTVAAIIRRAARELIGADGATLVLREGDNCYYAEEDAIAPLWKGRRFPMDLCISGWAMRNRKPVVVEDIYADARTLPETYQPTFVKSLLMVPIRTVEPIGAIGNYWADRYQPTEQDVALMQALANAASMALENVRIHSELEHRVQERTAQLEAANRRLAVEIQQRQRAEDEVRRISVTDELTNLYNRRGFFLLAEQELNAARRRNSKCSLIYADLDGLKQCNDRFGHAVGDTMIVDAARLLKRNFRETDIIARIGGDEFVVLAVDCRDDSATVLARLQGDIAEFNRNSDLVQELSLSVGIVESPSQTDASLETLVAQADKAMYAQKSAKPHADDDAHPGALTQPTGQDTLHVV